MKFWKRDRGGEEPNQMSVWLAVVKGLAKDPAYLLIFAIAALFFLPGAASLISGAVLENNVAIGIGAFVDVAALLAAIYVIRLDKLGFRQYHKGKSRRKTWPSRRITAPERVEGRLREFLNRHLVEGDLTLGLSYKDPSGKVIMTHTAAGDYAERDRMSDIMASFIRAKQGTTGLEFTKVVIPKSGNVLFSIKVAEKLNVDIVAFRGEAYPITEPTDLPFTKNYFDGSLEENDDVIIIDDVTFRGDTIERTLDWLKRANVSAKAVFVLAAHEQHVESIRSMLATTYEGTEFYPIITI